MSIADKTWRALAIGALIAIGMASAAKANLSGSTPAPSPNSGQDSAPLRMAQMRGAPTTHWDLKPGYYRIRAMESQMCAGHKAESWPQADHFVLMPCEHTDNLALYVAIIPSGAVQGAFTIRPYGGPGDTSARMLSCATVARGVIVGAPRVDIHPCDFMGRGATRSWCFVGGADQLFWIGYIEQGIHDTGANIGSFKLDGHGQPEPEGHLWDVRDHGRDPGTDILIWGSPNSSSMANEAFELLYDRPLDTTDDLACLPH